MSRNGFELSGKPLESFIKSINWPAFNRSVIQYAALSAISCWGRAIVKCYVFGTETQITT